MALLNYGASAEAERRFAAEGRDRTRCGETIAKRLALAFILYGLMATLFLAVNIPPFQNPDEINHFQRAAQIADGGWIGERLTTETGRFMAGGQVDPAILEASAPFSDAVRFHPDGRASRVYWTPNHYWSDKREMEGFANTAIYPPGFTCRRRSGYWPAKPLE